MLAGAPTLDKSEIAEIKLQALVPGLVDRDPRIAKACAAGVNDPSAGSPTEALLRLVLPLSDKVY